MSSLSLETLALNRGMSKLRTRRLLEPFIVAGLVELQGIDTYAATAEGVEAVDALGELPTLLGYWREQRKAAA